MHLTNYIKRNKKKNLTSHYSGLLLLKGKNCHVHLKGDNLLFNFYNLEKWTPLAHLKTQRTVMRFSCTPGIVTIASQNKK
jgi:hypothetical protein